MSKYSNKKNEKIDLQMEALNLLRNADLKSNLRLNLLTKINSNNQNSIKSAISTLKSTSGISNDKPITMNAIKSHKVIVTKNKEEAKASAKEILNAGYSYGRDTKIKQAFKNVDQFNPSILLKTNQLLSGYRSKQYFQTNYSSNGKKVVEVLISKPNMTREEVLALGTKFSQLYSSNKVKGSFTISCKTDLGWRRGQMTNFGNSPKIYRSDEYGETNKMTYDQIAIFFIESQLLPTAGGCNGQDIKNNCLYDALFYYLQNSIPWKTPDDFRVFLKVNQNRKIDIKYIPKIEKYLKTFQINITGDHTYISSVNSNKKINLTLIDGHYDYLENPIKTKSFNISFKEREPMIFNVKTFKCYDGKIERNLPMDEKYNITSWRTKYILIDLPNDKYTLKEYYDVFKSDANTLKELTNGSINLYKTGSDKITALTLFDKYTKYINEADHINQSEADWINGASTGALSFSEPYIGTAYSYDVKSMYPSIMRSSQTFPFKEGQFKIINQSDLENKLYFDYGIYRCHILKSSDEQLNKLFRFNKLDKYTHIDLMNAKRLNLIINIISDGEVNFLHYSRDKCLVGSELFSEFVDILFKLKESKISRAKSILNILWGALSEKNKQVVRASKTPTDKIIEMDKDSQVLGIVPTNGNNSTITIITNKKNDQYKSGFARIKPFLIAKGRSMICGIMEPYKNIVKRCHTDGFILSELPNNIKVGSELGDLVYEGKTTELQIINLRKPIILIV